MNDYYQYKKFINNVVTILLIGLFFFGDIAIFSLVYIFFAVFMIIRTLRSKFDKQSTIFFIIAYFMIMTIQLCFAALVVFDEVIFGLSHYFSKIFSVLIVLLPLSVERFFTVNKYVEFYPPSVEEMAAISFEQMKNGKDKIISTFQDLNKVKQSATPENLDLVISDLHRHSSTQYINNGSLTDEYFNMAYESLKDPYLYIVISNTGSAASEIISIFTKKSFNHASLSFDYDLKTIISYNGGENVYPPGLNHEMINFFYKKEDASILVYKLSTNMEQKKKIIDKVKEINEEGSAYNIMGLLLKYSHKPNIMFCSQFVYNMLKFAELEYFNKKDGNVRPTDFVELDYYRKLEFVYKVSFNENIEQK